MRFWKEVLDFYINSSIHVAIAIACLTAVTALSFRIPLDNKLLLFIFLASVTSYNFIKYAGIAKLHHFSLARNIRVIQIFSFLVFLGLIFSAFLQSIPVLLLGGLMAIFTGLYALPVFNQKRNLRALPGVKIYIIAFVVSTVTVLMPLIDHQSIFERDVILEFLQRFLIVIALVLPFEIRDLNYDMAQLGTIPQVIGVKRTKIIGYILAVCTVIAEFLKDITFFASIIGVLAVALMAVIALKNSTIRQGRYFASFWVEAVPIFWFLILLVLFQII